MMNATVRCAALLTLVLATACTNAILPTAPTSTNPVPATTAPAPMADSPRSFPPVSRPARIYVGDDLPQSAAHGSSVATRYVLYDDGTFALQYSSAKRPFFEYRGTYTEANALVIFVWEASSVAGPWGATGLLSDDALSVQYNIIMQLSDFVDARYVRSR
jgi:hypothetical protein